MKAINRLLLHISLASGVGPQLTFGLLQRLFREQHPDIREVNWDDLVMHLADIPFERVYDYSVSDFLAISRMGEERAIALHTTLQDPTVLEKELQLIDQHGVTLITPFDAAYPAALRNIYAPPPVLYCKGNVEFAHDFLFAVVGARKANEYAQRAVDRLIPSLVGREWTIVSGGAEGADAFAHRATLAAGGKTIAVLGSGLLRPYPSFHEPLFEKIIQSGGTLITPFAMTFGPDRPNFPARNRIIAGLSSGCLVLQAAVRSGALITAEFALEQGRHVFALPGAFDDELSAGCHKLIKQGAVLVQGASDIFEEFGQKPSEEEVNVIPARLLKVEVNGPLRFDSPLLVHMDTATTLDELLEKTKLGADELQEQLFVLQLEGRVRQNFAGTWQRIG